MYLFLVLPWVSLVIDSVMGWDSLNRKKEGRKSFFILRLGAMFTHVMRCDAINFAPHKENRADLLLIAGCLSRALCHRSWCDIVTAAPYVPYLCWGKKKTTRRVHMFCLIEILCQYSNNPLQTYKRNLNDTGKWSFRVFSIKLKENKN